MESVIAAQESPANLSI